MLTRRPRTRNTGNTGVWAGFHFRDLRGDHRMRRGPTREHKDYSGA